LGSVGHMFQPGSSPSRFVPPFGTFKGGILLGVLIELGDFEEVNCQDLLLFFLFSDVSIIFGACRIRKELLGIAHLPLFVLDCCHLVQWPH
jgi:hypothetical protein